MVSSSRGNVFCRMYVISVVRVLVLVDENLSQNVT